MLINKFNPAFTEIGGTIPPINVGACVDIDETYPFSGMNVFHDVQDNIFYPENVSLKVLASGESDISYAWQTGVSEGGPYANYSTGYADIFSTGAALINTNIWYRVELDNTVCTNHTHGVFVGRYSSESNNHYKLEVIDAFDNESLGADACCNSILDTEDFYFKPDAHKANGSPDPFGDPCWTRKFQRRYLVTGLLTEDIHNWKEADQEKLLSDVAVWGNAAYDLGYSPDNPEFWGDSSFICLARGYGRQANLDALEGTYGTGVGFTHKVTAVFLLDTEDGPHSPTTDPTGNWGTGNYFMHNASNRFNWPKESCGASNNDGCGAVVGAMTRPNTLYYETGTGIYSVGANIPNSGGILPGFNSSLQIYPGVITMKSGVTDTFLKSESAFVNCNHCDDSDPVTLIYVYGGTSVPEITGRYSFRQDIPNVSNLLESGLFSDETLIDLYDGKVSANYCECIMANTDPCNGLGDKVNHGYCQKDSYHTVGVKGGDDTYDCTEEFEHVRTIKHQYRDGPAASAELTPVEGPLHPGELFFMGAEMIPTTSIASGGAVVETFPTFSVNREYFQGYHWDPCSFAVKFSCSGISYFLEEDSPCTETLTLNNGFSGRFEALFGEGPSPSGVHDVITCGTPNPDSVAECGPPGEEVPVYLCQPYGTQERSRMALASKFKRAVRTTDGSCVNTITKIYSTAQFTPETLPVT